MLDSITVDNNHSSINLFVQKNQRSISSNLKPKNLIEKRIVKIFKKQTKKTSPSIGNNSYLNIYLDNRGWLNSDWTSLSVICFGVCELSIRCSFAKHPNRAFDQD